MWVWRHLPVQRGNRVIAWTVAQYTNNHWALSVNGTSIYFVFQKKKTITDVLATSEPKPGSPADLQNLVTQYFSDKRSVIEQEELKLQGESDQIPFNSEVQSVSADVFIHQGHHLPSCLLQTPASCPVMTWHIASPLIWNRVSDASRFGLDESSYRLLLLNTHVSFSSCPQFVLSGQKFKSSTRQRVLWFCSLSVAPLSEPLSSSSTWHTGDIC